MKMRGFNASKSAKGSVEMDIPVIYCDRKHENKVRSAKLKDVQVNEGFNFNLFSINKMLLKGFTLKGDNKSLTISKGEVSFVFDTMIHTKRGVLFCAIMKRKLAGNGNETVNASIDAGKEIKRILKTSVVQAH